MIDSRSSNTNSLIFNEFDEKQKLEFFDIKKKKFIQNIDSFYYSVYLDADFTSETMDKRVKYFRDFIQYQFSMLKTFDDVAFNVPSVPKYFNIRHIYYAESFDILVERPEHYRILMTRFTANDVSPQILVQIASMALWTNGVRESICESLEDVRLITKHFGFQIVSVLENRVDYCWHTNYIQDPENFLRSDNFAKMRLSRMSDSFSHEHYYGNEDVEIDYKSLGKKSSNNIFFRIYHKSKEVVQLGYKAFFLKEWLCKGLINRYDYYCLSLAYENHNWYSLDKCRLNFYLEYGSNEEMRNYIQNVILEKEKLKYDELHHLANMLTPPVTVVMNVEFQTMRKFSASLLLNESDFNRNRYGAASRIFTLLDEWKAITNYLTLHSVRFVEAIGDENKSRRPDCPFWDALRHTKNMDMKYSKKDAAALRQFNHERNVKIVQKRALNNIVSFNLYTKGENEDSPDVQIADFLNNLNDNDFAGMEQNKKKKIRRADYSNPIGLDNCNARYSVVDNATGEIYSPDYSTGKDESK